MPRKKPPTDKPRSKYASALRVTKQGIHITRMHQEAADAMMEIPREQLHKVLVASGNPKAKQLGIMLTHPDHERRDFAEMCALTGNGIKDIAQIFQDAQIGAGKILQAQHAPAIMETNAQAAIGRPQRCSTCQGEGRLFAKCPECKGDKDRSLECATCDGSGTIEAGTCLTCGETGWIMGAGDPNAVKGFMESTGLTQKAGINVGVQVNQRFGGTSGEFEELMRQAEKPSRTQIIEAEVVSE